MTDQPTLATGTLAPGERVAWSGRSRPAGVLLAILPNLILGAFASCLALGFAPASNALGPVLSPVVESALRTVTPLPVPRIVIERSPRDPDRQRGDRKLDRISFLEAQATGPDAPIETGPSDVDIGVGAFLAVCKTLLLYLGAATLVLAARTFVRQVRGRHVVTDLRVMTFRGGSTDSIPLRAVHGIRSRRHPFGTSLALDVAGRRRPFALLGLDDGVGAERAVAAGQGATRA